MFYGINPTQTEAWKKLTAHFESTKNRTLKDLFKQDPNRFDKYSLTLAKGDIVADFSKNIIDETTLNLLLELAKETKLQENIEAMFSGEIINRTEGRAVLHTALRNFSGKPVYVDGKDVMPGVKAVLDKMKAFCDKVMSGEWKEQTVRFKGIDEPVKALRRVDIVAKNDNNVSFDPMDICNEIGNAIRDIK